jgi:hypothetical protein
MLVGLFKVCHAGSVSSDDMSPMKASRIGWLQLWLLLAAGAALLNCGAKTAGAEGDGSSNDPSDSMSALAECPELLAGQQPVECRTERCEQALSEPERRVQWSVAVDGSQVGADGRERGLSEQERAMRADCVVAELEALGIQAQAYAGATISWESSYAAAADVLKVATLGSVYVSCAAESCEKCEKCEGLPEQQCRDAMCSPIFGKWLNEEQHCALPAYAGCVSAVQCGQLITPATDLQGYCWRFSNTCLPSGFTSTPSGNDACNYDSFVDLPTCEAR